MNFRLLCVKSRYSLGYCCSVRARQRLGREDGQPRGVSLEDVFQTRSGRVVRGRGRGMSVRRLAGSILDNLEARPPRSMTATASPVLRRPDLEPQQLRRPDQVPHQLRRPDQELHQRWRQELGPAGRGRGRGLITEVTYGDAREDWPLIPILVPQDQQGRRGLMPPMRGTGGERISQVCQLCSEC